MCRAVSEIAQLSFHQFPICQGSSQVWHFLRTLQARCIQSIFLFVSNSHSWSYLEFPFTKSRPTYSKLLASRRFPSLLHLLHRANNRSEDSNVPHTSVLLKHFTPWSYEGPPLSSSTIFKSQSTPIVPTNFPHFSIHGKFYHDLKGFPQLPSPWHDLAWPLGVGGEKKIAPFSLQGCDAKDHVTAPASPLQRLRERVNLSLILRNTTS